MKERKTVREELRDQGADRLLERHGRTPEWQLPEGYLEQLTEAVIAKSAAPETGAVRPAFRFPLRKIAAAAAVLLALGCWYFYPTEKTDLSIATGSPDWEQIPTEDLQAYVDAHLDEFELDLLAAYTLEGAEEQPSFPGAGISTEALEDYLETDDWLLDAELPNVFDEL